MLLSPLTEHLQQFIDTNTGLPIVNDAGEARSAQAVNETLYMRLIQPAGGPAEYYLPWPGISRAG